MIRGFAGNRRGVSLGGVIVFGMLLLLVAVILIPFSNRPDYRKNVTCTSNLKQLGLASLMYEQDWGETWMPAKGWASDKVLQAYVKNDGVWDCPEIKGTTALQTDYEYNINVAGVRSKDFKHDPASVVLMADGIPADRETDSAGMVFSYPHKYNVKCFMGVEYGGRGGINRIFCDAHVKWARMEDAGRYNLKIK